MIIKAIEYIKHLYIDRNIYIMLYGISYVILHLSVVRFDKYNKYAKIVKYNIFYNYYWVKKLYPNWLVFKILLHVERWLFTNIIHNLQFCNISYTI